MALRIAGKVISREALGLCLMLPKTLWGRLPEAGARLVAVVNDARRFGAGAAGRKGLTGTVLWFCPRRRVSRRPTALSSR